MVIGFIVSEIIDIAALTLRGAGALYKYIFAVEEQQVETNVKLIHQIQELEKMCSNLSQQRIDDIKMYTKEIEELNERLYLFEMESKTKSNRGSNPPDCAQTDHPRDSGAPP